MAGGAAGDVDGAEGDEGRPGPELHGQDSGQLELVAGQEEAEQDVGGGKRHPVDYRRADFDRVIRLFPRRKKISEYFLNFLDEGGAN